MKLKGITKNSKIAYVASGDFPQKNACYVQVAKNAQAWANEFEAFEFIVNLSFTNWFRRNSINIHSYYALKKNFSVCFFPWFDFERLNIPILKNIYYKRVAKKCKKDGVDLIFTRTNVFARYAIQNDIPVIVETHSPPEKTKDKLDLYSQMEDPKFLALVTISEALKTRYVDFGLPEDKIMVAPDGVDLERFTPPLSIKQARTELKLPHERLLAVYVGHLYDNRGVEEIIYAAERCQDVDFLLVGGHDEDIERWRQKTKKMSNIKFQGFVNNGDVPKWLWAGNILLMPYSTKCVTAEWMSPLKLFEYMAAGRAIISTDLPALRTVLKDQDNAILVEPDSGDSLTSAIQNLVKKPDQCERLGKRAYEDVAQYTWNQRVRSILSFISGKDVS